jgi:uncharacterized protein HemX
MADTSDFDVTTPRRATPRRGGLVAALLLGLVLGGGSIALWKIRSDPPQQPQANVSNETTQSIKDLQSTQQKIADQLRSIQQTLTWEQAETKRLSDQVTG